MQFVARKIFKWTVISLGVLLLLIALALAGFGVVMTRAPAYRAQLQSWLSERAKLDIEFADISARWRWFGPELVFDRAVLRSADRQRVLAVAQRGGVGFDIWAALRTGRLTAGQFSLTGAEFRVVRTQDGKIVVVGQEELPDFDRVEALQVDNLPVGHLEVRDVSLRFQDLKTGRGPWLVRDVQFDIDRDNRQVQMTGKALLPPALGKELQFKANSSGSLKEVDALQWEAAISGANLDLAGWAQLMPEDWPAPKAGKGSFQLSSDFRGAVLLGATGQLNLTNVSLALPQWNLPLPQADVLQLRDDSGVVIPSPEIFTVSNAVPSAPIVYERVGADFRLEHQDANWRASISQLQLSRANAEWRPSQAEFNLNLPAEGGVHATGSADLLVLDNLWPLLAYLSESEQHARWRALNAGGRIANLKLQFDRDNDDAPARYQVSADLSDIGIAAVGKDPGFTALSGRLSASETQGALALDSRDFSLALPRLFRTPLPVDKLVGAIEWRRMEKTWQLRSDALKIDNSDGHVQAKFTLQLPDAAEPDASPIIDLRAEASDLNAQSAPRYMPAGILGGKTLAWMDRAFAAGRVAHAECTLQGPLRSFPFRNQEGLFLIKADIEDLTLEYQPGWMPATHIKAQAEFRNAGFSGTASAATINSLQITNAFARIKDFKNAELELKANGGGDLQPALDYLQQSPIGPALGGTFQSLQATGPMTAEVNLLLPLKNLGQRKLDVQARVSNAQVGLKNWEQQASAVNGALRVRGKAISDIAMSGQFLQGPFAVNTVATGNSKTPATFIASGHAGAAQLSDFLHLPGFVKIAGDADWRLLAIGLGAAERTPGKSLFTIDSDLKGLSIDLPAPFKKMDSDETRALHIEAESGAGAAVLLRGSLGGVRSVVRMQKQGEAWSFDRAGLRADGMAASLPAHAGLRVEGAIDDLVLDDWLKLASASTSNADRVGRPVNQILRAANVNVGRLHLYGYEWPNVRGVLQATDQGWRVDVSGPQVSGQVLAPYRFDAAHPLTLNLEHLVLNKTAKPSGEGANPNATVDPRDLPALRAEIDHFEYGEHDFGVLHLHADKLSQGLQVTSARAESDAFMGTGSGMWSIGPGGQSTRISVDMESSDVRSAMQQLKYADFIEAKHGKLHADLQWPGGIDENFLGRASGNIEIQAEDGQLLNVQPGAGRVLGLLSIAALPRRLSLDFRDLTDKGLRFDSIHGSFNVKAGDAHTDDLLLSGPAAEIGIAGRLGFAKRDYDQTAVVTGNFGSSLPVAGTLAGGPVVGAALLVFTQLFKEPLKGVARGYYRITGNWDNPTIERIDAEAAREGRDSLSETEKSP